MATIPDSFRALVAEQRDGDETNALYFSDRGMMIDDTLLDRLTWAPILPVATK